MESQGYPVEGNEATNMQEVTVSQKKKWICGKERKEQDEERQKIVIPIKLKFLKIMGGK